MVLLEIKLQNDILKFVRFYKIMWGVCYDIINQFLSLSIIFIQCKISKSDEQQNNHKNSLLRQLTFKNKHIIPHTIYFAVGGITVFLTTNRPN